MYYTFHILPYVNNIKDFKIEEHYGDVATMIDDIEMIYQINITIGGMCVCPVYKLDGIVCKTDTTLISWWEF